MAAHRMLLLDFPAENRRFQRNFRLRPSPLEELSETKLQKKYRFNSEGIQFICDLVRDDLIRDTNRNHSLTVETQVLVALKFFASGSFLDDIGDIFGLDKGTVSRIIHTVAAALVEHKGRFIRWPDARERRQIKETFIEKHRFPNVIGCVDGTHIKVQAPYPPREDADAMAHPMLYEAAFFCRKHFYSINVQGICNHEERLTNIVARWPGATHDSHIFRESEIAEHLERNQREGYLLGDSGYPCKPYLLTPYLNPGTPSQRRYNRAQIRSRNIIERTFGIMKRRFHVLKGGIRMQPDRVCNIIVACAVLHNICVDRRLPILEDSSDSDSSSSSESSSSDEGEIYEGHENGRTTREYVTNTFF